MNTFCASWTFIRGVAPLLAAWILLAMIFLMLVNALSRHFFLAVITCPARLHAVFRCSLAAKLALLAAVVRTFALRRLRHLYRRQVMKPPMAYCNGRDHTAAEGGSDTAKVIRPALTVSEPICGA